MLSAVRAISRSQSNGGFCALSGPYRGDPCSIRVRQGAVRAHSTNESVCEDDDLSHDGDECLGVFARFDHRLVFGFVIRVFSDCREGRRVEAGVVVAYRPLSSAFRAIGRYHPLRAEQGQ
jgi:hypothetical protein